MGCSWVNYIARIDGNHSNVYVVCPTCGRWGSILRRTHNRLGIRHRDDSRCAITWHLEFRNFAENIHGTVLRVSAMKFKESIRKGEYIVRDYDYLLRVAPNGQLKVLQPTKI